MFGLANFIEREESVDGKNITLIVCRCGYIIRHVWPNTLIDETQTIWVCSCWLLIVISATFYPESTAI